jgi:hypothetical protein
MQNPLDIVISYVNSTDLKWRNKLRLQNLPINPVRYNFFGEIYFSLRLLQKNMPWVHHIFILHDEQPFSLDFLSSSFREKIIFIDHKDFIPYEYLPTFNSQVIECFLPKIPNLGEYFLYMNDDFFITRPVFYHTFFQGPKMKIFIRRRKQRFSHFKLSQAPVLLDREISSQVFSIEMKKPLIYLEFEHLPFCFHRPILEEAYSIFYKYFDKTSRFNKIRKYDIQNFTFKNHLQNYTNFSALTIYLQMMLHHYHAHVVPFHQIYSLSISLTNQIEFQKIMYSNPLILNIQHISPSFIPFWNKVKQKFLQIQNPQKKFHPKKKSRFIKKNKYHHRN